MEVKELKSKGLKREFSITIGVSDLKEKKIKIIMIILRFFILLIILFLQLFPG